MVEYIMQHWWTIWAVVAMVCLIMEMSSGDFYITCFGVGALVALVASLFAVPLWAQVIVFAVFSVLSIFFLRPHLVALMHRGSDERLSNAQAIIGRVGEVSETVKAKWSSYYTPCPGGVGPMTVAMLMRNVFRAYTIANGTNLKCKVVLW